MTSLTGDDRARRVNRRTRGAGGSRRSWACGAAGLVVLVAGCTSTSPAASGPPVTIGLIASLSGVYQAIGEDTRDGFMLYIDTHGGQLGGRSIEVVIVDEADGGAAALAAVDALARRPDVLAVTGLTNAQTATSALPGLRARGAPLVTSNAFPDLDDVEAAWSTGFMPDEPGRALAPYLRSAVSGPVWVMAADTAIGRSNVDGFATAFVRAGGVLANDGQTPLVTPRTTNFLPYLTQAKQSGAKAVYALYSGAEAATFVQQYAQSDARDLPLFGPGFLTEGRVLAAQGRAAVGVRTALNYAPDLDNPSNRRFADAWRAKHGSVPTTYAMASWDAAYLLDKAIAAAGADLSPAAVNAAIERIGVIDSPRGDWQFSARHSPVQKWYLRRVQVDGRTLTNSLIQDLDILGAQGSSS